MERPTQRRLLDRNQVNSHANNEPEALIIKTECIRQYPYNEASLMSCFGERWKGEINRFLRARPGFSYSDPGYELGHEPDANQVVNQEHYYFDYLAIRVQWNVDQILKLRETPILRPEDFSLNPADFKILGPEQFRSMDNKTLLERARAIDRYLAEHGDSQRIVRGTSRTDTDVLQNLESFFDRMKLKEQNLARLEAQCLSDSLVLASEIDLDCATCHTVPQVIQPNDSTGVWELLTGLHGIHSINDPGLQGLFRTGFIGRFNIKNGSLITFDFFDGSFYILFVDQNLFEVSGPYLVTEGRINRLPKLFLEFLRRKGIISKVAIELYSILAIMPVLPGDEWI